MLKNQASHDMTEITVTSCTSSLGCYLAQPGQVTRHWAGCFVASTMLVSPYPRLTYNQHINLLVHISADRSCTMHISHQSAEHCLRTACLTVSKSAMWAIPVLLPALHFWTTSVLSDCWSPDCALQVAARAWSGKNDSLDVICFGTSTLVPNLRDCLAKGPLQMLLLS